VRGARTSLVATDISSQSAVAMVQQRLTRALLTVVVPTLNEAANIGWVLGRLPVEVDEIILVDGRSTDGTVEVARQVRPDLVLVSQPARGKGAAVLTGMGMATGDIVIMIDADGSMDPAEIPALVGALFAGADLVKGSRASSGGDSLDISPVRRLGNWALTRTANRVYRQRWRELCYGYAAFWRDVLPVLGITDVVSALVEQAVVDPVHANLTAVTDTNGGLGYGFGFEIEALLFCRAARSGLRIAEVFSFEHRRRSGESNLATWRDGWRVATTLFRERKFPGVGEPRRTARAYPILPALHEIDVREGRP
jgi:glycosyltransferase involved in cell wall biosynthesis